jgi:hypothetical protein
VKSRARANGPLPRVASTGTGEEYRPICSWFGRSNVAMSIRDFSPLYKWVSSLPPLMHETLVFFLLF